MNNIHLVHSLKEVYLNKSVHTIGTVANLCRKGMIRDNWIKTFFSKHHTKGIDHSQDHSFFLCLITFAGTPAAIEKGGISEVTTLPAPITEDLPIVTFGNTVT